MCIRDRPDGDGFSFAKKLREKQDIPIIFLTAKDMDTDMMEGFESGADDYVTKPFHVQILICLLYTSSLAPISGVSNIQYIIVMSIKNAMIPPIRIPVHICG